MTQSSDAGFGTLGPLLKDRVAVVTGGAGAIGNAICQLFAAHGADVVVGDIHPQRTPETARRVEAQGRKALSVVADLTKREGIEQLRDAVLQTFGRVDVLVNGLGDWAGIRGPFEKSTEEEWERLNEINFLHVMRACKAFVPGMKERGWGRIVNFSSVEGIRGMARLVTYTAYKGAINSFTKSLGVELADTGIRVNCIAVDMTKAYQIGFYTEPPQPDRPVPPLIPAARWGEPEDVAKVALVLASDLASWVVGDIVLADGGSIAAGGWHRPPGGWWAEG